MKISLNLLAILSLSLILTVDVLSQAGDRILDEMQIETDGSDNRSRDAGDSVLSTEQLLGAEGKEKKSEHDRESAMKEALAEFLESDLFKDHEKILHRMLLDQRELQSKLGSVQDDTEENKIRQKIYNLSQDIVKLQKNYEQDSAQFLKDRFKQITG